MTGIYTQRLAAFLGSSADYNKLYETPADTPVVVRDLVLWNGSTAPNTGELNIVQPSTGEAFRLATFTDVPTGVARHVDVRQALAAGDELWIQAATWPYSILVTAYVFPAR